MSDLDTYLVMLSRRGVVFTESLNDDVTTILVEEQPLPGGIAWTGYTGFGFHLSFDRTGRLVALGASEG